MCDQCSRPSIKSVVSPASVSYHSQGTGALDEHSSHAILEYVPGSLTKRCNAVFLGHELKTIDVK